MHCADEWQFNGVKMGQTAGATAPDDMHTRMTAHSVCTKAYRTDCHTLPHIAFISHITCCCLSFFFLTLALTT